MFASTSPYSWNSFCIIIEICCHNLFFSLSQQTPIRIKVCTVTLLWCLKIKELALKVSINLSRIFCHWCWVLPQAWLFVLEQRNCLVIWKIKFDEGYHFAQVSPTIKQLSCQWKVYITRIDFDEWFKNRSMGQKVQEGIRE